MSSGVALSRSVTCTLSSGFDDMSLVLSWGRSLH